MGTDVRIIMNETTWNGGEIMSKIEKTVEGIAPPQQYDELVLNLRKLPLYFIDKDEFCSSLELFAHNRISEVDT